MKHKQKGYVLSVVIAVVAVAAIIIAFYVYKSSNISKPVQTPNVIANTEVNYVTYVGKTESGDGFTIKYPSSWTYYRYNCNISGMAFWPTEQAPDFSSDVCAAGGILASAPIILTLSSEPILELKDKKYELFYDSMFKSLVIAPKEAPVSTKYNTKLVSECVAKYTAEQRQLNAQFAEGYIKVSFSASTTLDAASKILRSYGLSLRDASEYQTTSALLARVIPGQELDRACVLSQDKEVGYAYPVPVYSGVF